MIPALDSASGETPTFGPETTPRPNAPPSRSAHPTRDRALGEVLSVEEAIGAAPEEERGEIEIIDPSFSLLTSSGGLLAERPDGGRGWRRGELVAEGRLDAASLEAAIAAGAARRLA